ncbi:Na(+)-translocating NADH-quinone reductase subunit C [Alcanivorax quisquiliarum]|uniref:Na(+)-translocating NADH-quinone reductase subunit C n=1 Tax=Alcanivorax quisquiliarum TaxID=2933565 RepID=A0ABT0E3V9_9GAMM|nr:Na(+)-translocating NADH-quinone reductase subunit C [Alcanivorax quisquiliarum]MCK0536503.1 Na(+)-translocating NADH-quinone reductase subunit C [Alcanivorax quisquiliarum]
MAFDKDSIGGTLAAALVLCIVCGVVVSTAAVALRPQQEANRILDRQSNVLRAAGRYSPEIDIAAEFEKIEHRFVDLRTGEEVEMPADYDQQGAASDPEQSTLLTQSEDIARVRRVPHVGEVYLARDEQGELESIILPVHGYGLWSTMYGFLSLEADANTIAGLVFYEHGETPGLGGEIDNPRWRQLWQGKQLLNDEGEVAIQVVKGSVDERAPGAETRVDGLSGATLTSVGVSNMVRFWVGENGFGPFLERLRESSSAALDQGVR